MKLFQSQFELCQRLLDALIVAACLPFAFWLYYGSWHWSEKYTITAIAAIPIFYASARISGLYRAYFVQFSEQQIKALLLTWAMTLAGLLLMGYAFKSTHELSRVTLGLYALIAPVLLLTSRFTFLQVIRAARARGYGVRNAIIIGGDDNALALARSIAAAPWLGISLQGFVSLGGERAMEAGGHGPALGQLDDLEQLVRRADVDIVYVSVSMSDREQVNAILRVLGNSTVSIFLVPDIFTAEIMQGTWVTLGDVPTVCVIDGPARGVNSVLKRLEDLLIAGAALLLLSLPMLVIAIGVRLSSPGPALYKQTRYGANGRPITVWKFRTMKVMESTSEFTQARKNDDRVTGFGRFLRRTSLDELPQFFNVLKGDMSIVGPRPHPVALNEEFRTEIMGYMLRHKVKPGITGLAQVNGYRGETDTHEKMEHRIRYDIEYINNWSLWLDLAIILKTPFTLMRGENAY
ncbi:MAG: undecaprenyl-phosphate glucose phosphotransferase [Pseudomonadales bacterium]|nr:undecaprenyl-phosphate glucose phosphotransferase [Halieaceae bacterium]MCP5190097.1 undecaprenyl-phosphate glucose phosphotransferase [Pseudomonadales bacterium]